MRQIKIELGGIIYTLNVGSRLGKQRTKIIKRLYQQRGQWVEIHKALYLREDQKPFTDGYLKSMDKLVALNRDRLAIKMERRGDLPFLKWREKFFLMWKIKPLERAMGMGK